MTLRPVQARFLAAALAAAVMPWTPQPLEAQSSRRARVQAAENFRAEPNGTLLGALEPGTTMSVATVSGQWVQANLEGWMWARSLQLRDGGSFDLVVSAEGGENLRDGPSGEILGRLVDGTLLEELERDDGWIRVRRTGWIWAASVEVSEVGPAAPPRPEPDRWMRSGEGGAAILSGPDGDTLAHTLGGAELRVLAREGNWARVRIEGWTWAPGGDDAASDTAVIADPLPSELRAAEARFTGRMVSMELQFISLEEAEQVRTDFFEGEPFLLTRAVAGDRSFVYVAVPPEALAEVRDIVPLERIRVVGRVRTVASGLTGNPILELLDLYRAPG